MLDRIEKIKQRRESGAIYARPVINATTGKAMIDDNGAPTKFVPNSCRKKCPIAASNKFKDNPQMKERLLVSEKDHGEWKIRMAHHAKETGKLPGISLPTCFSYMETQWVDHLQLLF